jgi:hypothetical protein
MAEYGPHKKYSFSVKQAGNEGGNIALFALVAQKIITEKR